MGDYVPDLFEEDSLIVEVKAIAQLAPVHRLHCLNYLRATGLRMALLLDFSQRRVDVARIVHAF